MRYSQLSFKEKKRYAMEEMICAIHACRSEDQLGLVMGDDPDDVHFEQKNGFFKVEVSQKGEGPWATLEMYPKAWKAIVKTFRV